MESSVTKGVFVGYVVLAVTTALMMFGAAHEKLTFDPGTVGGLINRVVDVPLGWLRVLAAYEIVAALGLLVGIWRPLVGIAASVALILYFLGQHAAISLAPGPLAEWIGLSPPIQSFALAIAALALRFTSTRLSDAPIPRLRPWNA